MNFDWGGWSIGRRPGSAQYAARVSQAHRSHLYQRVANGGWGHARVSLLYAAAALLALPIPTLPPVWLNRGTAAYFLAVLALGTTLDRRAT